jgi:hypothetical protein
LINVDEEPREKVQRKKPVMEPIFRASLVKMKTEELEMNTTVKDIAIYFIYIVIVFIISYGNRDPNSYLVKISV